MILSTTLALALLAPSTYDPMKLDPSFTPKVVDMTLRDADRKRDIPIKLYLPESTKPAPVVIFSHGLGGSREGNKFLGRHLAARGYLAVFTQHPGSDTSVWQAIPPRERMAAMQKAASTENFLLRQQDIRFLLRDLERLNKSDVTLKNRLDLKKLGMSGHSFGAVTTQAVSGENFPGRIGQTLTEKGIKAAILYSGGSARENSFRNVSIPWLIMTGTHDTSPIGRTDLAQRLAVYPQLPPGDKFELVFFEAEHSAFTDTVLPGDKLKRNPNHHRAMLALTTAFWDAYMKDDNQAKTWIKSPEARSVLEPKDTWKSK